MCAQQQAQQAQHAPGALPLPPLLRRRASRPTRPAARRRPAGPMGPAGRMAARSCLVPFNPEASGRERTAYAEILRRKKGRIFWVWSRCCELELLRKSVKRSAALTASAARSRGECDVVSPRSFLRCSKAARCSVQCAMGRTKASSSTALCSKQKNSSKCTWHTAALPTPAANPHLQWLLTILYSK